MLNWTDWKWWILILSLLIGTIISLWIYPQTKQDPAIFKELETSEVIVVFLPKANWIDAEQLLWTYYDQKQYYLLEKFYDEIRQGWWVKIDKIKQ